jgi:hypothetical protein
MGCTIDCMAPRRLHNIGFASQTVKEIITSGCDANLEMNRGGSMGPAASRQAQELFSEASRCARQERWARSRGRQDMLGAARFDGVIGHCCNAGCRFFDTSTVRPGRSANAYFGGG